MFFFLNKDLFTKVLKPQLFCFFRLEEGENWKNNNSFESKYFRIINTFRSLTALIVFNELLLFFLFFKPKCVGTHNLKNSTIFFGYCNIPDGYLISLFLFCQVALLPGVATSGILFR